MIRPFEIFTKASATPVAVKRGFSWPGFFFTWIWAISRGLWAFGALLFVIGALAGVFVMFAFGGNPIISTIISLVVCFFVGANGNSWRCRKLERDGYSVSRTIRAASATAALAAHTRGDAGATASGSGLISVPSVFQSVFAVSWLTWKAAFRFRLFLVVTALLLAAVVGLPWMLHDPHFTAQEFTQVQLTYTLSAVTALLGLATLWLACGTLARDIEECQMQVVVTKPIARWQIWLGKWFGLLSLNAALLAIAGACIYGQLMFQARKLDFRQQEVLRNEVFVARGVARPKNIDAEIDAEAKRILQDRLAKDPVSKADLGEVIKQIREGLKAQLQGVPPGYQNSWKIDLGVARHWLKGQPLFLRVKFNAAEKSPTGTFATLWQVGEPEKTRVWQTPEPLRLAPDTFHEIKIPADHFDANGIVTITVVNPNPATLVFPMEDGIEVLYREGGFGLNFIRGLGIILCWMTLFATLGLTASSFLGFNVAAFASLAALFIATMSTGTLASVVEQGTVMGANEETGVVGSSAIDGVAVPVFRGMLNLINLAKDFSPIDSLSTGRSIPLPMLGKAFVQIVLLLGGILGIFGIWTFSRRELATAQGTQ